MLNPLSAITLSPNCSKGSKPLSITMSLSEIDPSNSGETNVKAPSGLIPTKDFTVVWFFVIRKLSTLFRQARRPLHEEFSTVNYYPS